MSIKFITDSGSDILAPHDSRLNVLPLTIRFDEDEYKDGATITHHEFYEKLIESDTLPKTSQVTPYIFEEAISEARSDGSDVLIITISSRLSGTYQSACIAAAEFDEGVYVVDSENVSVGEKRLLHMQCSWQIQACNVPTLPMNLTAASSHCIRWLSLILLSI